MAPFAPSPRRLLAIGLWAAVGACTTVPNASPPAAGATGSETPPSAGLATAPSSAAAVTSPPSAPIAFTSERYGYSLELPAGWYVREEGAGLWTPYSLSYVGAGTDSFEEDYPQRGDASEDFPGVTFGLYVSSHDAGDETLDSWTDALARTTWGMSSCQGEPDRESITVDDEPARLLVYDRSDCTHDHHVLVVGLLHGASGYAMTWLARRGEVDARREAFEAILRTFRFT